MSNTANIFKNVFAVLVITLKFKHGFAVKETGYTVIASKVRNGEQFRPCSDFSFKVKVYTVVGQVSQ